MIVYTSFVIAFSSCTGAPSTSPGLEHFRATEDSEEFAKHPESYDKVTDPLRPKLVYVERKPLMTIHLGEIMAVTVEEEPPGVSLEEFAKEFLGQAPGQSGGTKRESKPGENDADYYRITFSLGVEGGRKLREFAQKHNKELFDLRLYNRRIGIVRILGPLDGNSFTAAVRGGSRQHIEELLSPVKEKVTWK
jgi:hypothetical protein